MQDLKCSHIIPTGKTEAHVSKMVDMCGSDCGKKLETAVSETDACLAKTGTGLI